MKKWTMFLLGLAIVIGFTQPCLGAGLRGQWQDAKKQADGELKKAKLKKLSSLVKFNKDLGPHLDAYEKAAGKKPSLKEIFKDKKLNKAFHDFTKRTYCEENWLYLNGGHKGKPEKIYGQFIGNDAKYQLNIDSGLRQKWDACASNNKWSGCKSLAEPTRQVIYTLVEKDTYPKFLLDLSEGRRKQISAIVGNYRQQVQKMPAEAGKARKVLLDALEKIEAGL